MADVGFDWDARKSRANKAKHGVSFEEARTAFLDEHARVIPDAEHSDDEERFVLEHPTRLYESPPRVARILQNDVNTLSTCHEKEIRLLELEAKPLFVEAEAADHDSTRRVDD